LLRPDGDVKIESKKVIDMIQAFSGRSRDPISLKHFFGLVPGSGLLLSRVILSGMLLLGLLASGCLQPGTTSAPTTGPTSPPTSSLAIDSRLSGQWTNHKDRVSIDVNDQGEPAGEVPVGQWYQFDADGTYIWVARHMTFAIGGIMVEEGRFKMADGILHLDNRTESFFPDEGSPQQKKYRSPIEDGKIYFQLTKEANQDVLILKTGDDQPETIYYPVME
jgi:hypothetical protein